MTEPIFSKAHVLGPSYGETILTVRSAFQDAGSSDPMKRITVPAGVWMCYVNNETRFRVTPVLSRAGYERTYESIVDTASFQVQTETDAEIHFVLSGTPNTNDNRITRAGVVLTRMGGFDI